MVLALASLHVSRTSMRLCADLSSGSRKLILSSCTSSKQERGKGGHYHALPTTIWGNNRGRIRLSMGRTPHSGNDSDCDPSIRPCTAIIWCRRKSAPGEERAAMLDPPPPEWRGVRGPSGVEGSERLPISLARPPLVGTPPITRRRRRRLHSTSGNRESITFGRDDASFVGTSAT